MKTFKYIAMALLVVSVISLNLLGGQITLINKSTDKAFDVWATTTSGVGLSVTAFPGQKVTSTRSDTRTDFGNITGAEVYFYGIILDPESGKYSTTNVEKEYRLENMPQWKKLDKGTNFDFEIIYDPASKKALDFHNTMGDVKKSKVDKERSLKFS